MQRYGQKTSKIPLKWGFPPFVTPKIFFKNRALSLLYPYGALTSYKKLEKTNEQSLRYSKSDYGRTDHGQGRFKDPLGKPGVQYKQYEYVLSTSLFGCQVYKFVYCTLVCTLQQFSLKTIHLNVVAFYLCRQAKEKSSSEHQNVKEYKESIAYKQYSTGSFSSVSTCISPYEIMGHIFVNIRPSSFAKIRLIKTLEHFN